LNARTALSHLRGNAVAYLALFVALGGTGAYAASKIGSKQIKTNAVKAKHIASSAVGADEIAPDAVGSSEIAAAAVAAPDLAEPPIEIAFDEPNGFAPATNILNNNGLIVKARCTGISTLPVLTMNVQGAGNLILSTITDDDPNDPTQDDPLVRTVPLDSVLDSFLLGLSVDNNITTNIQSSFTSGQMVHENGGARQTITFAAKVDGSQAANLSGCTVDGTATQTP
jgi:hypothetical protein